MNKLQFGWAEISLTPEKKLSLAGQFAERISEYVEKPITATALAVTAGEEQMVIVSADIISIEWSLIAAVRQRLANNQAGLDPRKVAVCAIHSHTGPKYTSSRRNPNVEGKLRSMLEELLPPGKRYVEKVNISNNPDIMTNDEVAEMLAERLSAVALEAWNNRTEGSFVGAFGRAPIGLCRRSTFSDGSGQMWGDTNTAVFTELEGGNDSGIELLYIYGADGALSGIVANIACPAQCVQHRLFVSPDYWGEAKMLLRRRFGEKLFLLPLCSAAGDQCPIDLIRFVEPESDVHDPNITRERPLRRKADPSMFDLAGMRKAGKRVANEIIEVYEEGLDEPITEAEFIHEVRDLQLPLRRVTMADAKKAEAAIREYLRNTSDVVDFNDVAKLQQHMGVLTRLRVQDSIDIIETEVHVMRLGPIAFATNPFELFLNYGNQIRARSKAEQTFLIQLCNGGEGYLPTEKAERGGHYSAFVSGGQIGHIGGEQLVRETLKTINGMF